ncbi:TPA: hypothetical protein ENS27_14365 [bacterium]|nr:hypothetical protein [bacterium]
MKIKLYLSLTIMLFLFALNSFGQANPFLIESVRSISTGGALVTVSNDENFAFINPAGLSNVEDSKLTALYLGTNFNIDSIKSIYELSSAYGEANDFTKLSTESINKLQSYDPILFVSPASIVYVHPNFAVSFLRSGVSVKAKFDKNENESIVNLSGVADSMLAGAMGFQIKDSMIWSPSGNALVYEASYKHSQSYPAKSGIGIIMLGAKGQ